MSTTGQAWVTLVTNDSYALGALVLAQSLKRSNTIHQLAVLVTPGVTNAMLEVLSQNFDLVKLVDVLDSQDATNLALLARPDLGITFTKLHCWNLTQYNKCVFLDADTLVVKNSDELFERDELSAAPDAGWPDCFNSGVFVYTPSEATFKALLDFALTHGSFDGGDQGLLNMFFNDWATKDIVKHLPFVYNMVATATYSYLPAFNVFGSNVKIAHFIGSNKPWLQSQPSSPALSSFLDLWWSIFKSDVSEKLNTDMIINCTVIEEGPQASKLVFTPLSPSPTTMRHEFVDPWDYVQPDHSDGIDVTTFETADVIDRLIEHLKMTQQQQTIPKQNFHPVTFPKQHSAPNLSLINEPTQKDSSVYSNILNDLKNKTHSLQQLHPKPLQNHSGQLYTQNEDIHEEPLRRVESVENIPKMISPPLTPACVELNIIQTKPEESIAGLNEGGLAGAIAGGQLDVIDDQWRKQSWEQGNIDYMGRDAFQNIWRKMSETVGEDIKPLEASAPQELADSEISIAAEIQQVPEKTDNKTELPKLESTDGLGEGLLAALSDSTGELPKLPVAPVETESPAQQPPIVQPNAQAEKPADSEDMIIATQTPKEDTAQIAAPLPDEKSSLPTVEQTTSPAAVDQTTSPAAVEQTTSPAAVEQTTSPAAVEQTTSPAAVDQTTSPAAVEQKTSPSVVEQALPTTTETVPQALQLSIDKEASPPAAKPPVASDTPVPVDKAPEVTTVTALEATLEASPLVVETQAPEQTSQSSPVTPPADKTPSQEAPLCPLVSKTLPPAAQADQTPQEVALPTKESPPSPIATSPPSTPLADKLPSLVEKPNVESIPQLPSPTVPSPLSPSSPEGSKAEQLAQTPPSPLRPDNQQPIPAEASQTAVGDAPVPPKRKSAKGKTKK